MHAGQGGDVVGGITKTGLQAVKEVALLPVHFGLLPGMRLTRRLIGGAVSRTFDYTCMAIKALPIIPVATGPSIFASRNDSSAR